MMKQETSNDPGRIGAKAYFSLCFGFIIGVGWIVAAGGWIADAGPFGASIAFLAGGLLLLPVGLCYAELGAQYPVNGGALYYAYRAFGKNAAFFMGYILLVSFISALIYFTLSVAWIVEVILPEIKGDALYTIRGANITLGGMMTAILATIALGVLTYLGATASARVQELVVALLILIVLGLSISAFIHGNPENLSPGFVSGGNSPLLGVGAVLIITPFFLSGFEAIAQSFGEKENAVTARTIATIITISIVGAAMFYIVIILAAAYIAPREELISADLPIEAAFRIGLDSPSTAKLVLIAGLLGLLTSWNACLFATARIFSVMGRAGLIWSIFAPQKGRFVSWPAVVVPSVLGLLGVVVGREMLTPILNASSLSIGMIFFAVCACRIALRAKISEEHRIARGFWGAFFPYLAAFTTFALALYIVYEPLSASEGSIPVEWIIFAVIVVLIALGWVKFRMHLNTTTDTDFEVKIKS